MGGICIVFVLLAALLVIRTNPGFVPVCFVAMTMSMVVNAHTGMVLGNLTSALVGVMALVGGATSQVAFAVLLSGMAGSTACAKLADRCKSRVRILGCGLVAGAAGGAVYICMGLLMGNAFLTILQSVLVSLAVALVASMVCLGSTPIWEQGFKILTPMKLMELCNPTNPLLHRLSMEAPGTYHHSIMVGNLAEAAAEAVGANPRLARAAAYYHDVGKLKAPAFYAENQPHDMPCLLYTSPVLFLSCTRRLTAFCRLSYNKAVISSRRASYALFQLKPPVYRCLAADPVSYTHMK